MRPNSVYTDAGVRITIDIVDVVFVALSSLLLVIWNTGYQYNKINMLDNCRRAMSALWRGNQVSASGREEPDGVPSPNLPFKIRNGSYRL